MKGKTLFTIALFCILALPVPSAGSPETAGPFPLAFSVWRLNPALLG